MLRLARESDLPRIVDIANWAALHSTANFATEPEPLADWEASWRATHAAYPWLVWVEDGAVAGFAKGGPHRSRRAYAWTAEVTVYVAPERHGQGIGSRLYERLIPLLRAQGYVMLLAGITSPNPASEKLHARLGFTRCGTFHRAGWKLEAWHDVGYWELELQPPGAPPQRIRSVADVWQP